MTRTKSQFKNRLAKLAGVVSHDRLADELGIKRSRLRNWLYKNTGPDALALKEVLGPKLDDLFGKQFPKRNGKN